MIRIPILSKFENMGSVELFGKIESGIIQPNMQATLLPTQEKLTIVSV